MGRKKLLDLEGKANGDKDFSTGEDETNSQEVSDLTELKLKLGDSGDIKVTVFRLADDEKDSEKIATYPLDQIDTDTVSEKFGGGKFRFRASKEDGTFLRQVTMTYAKPKLPLANNIPQVIQPKDNTKEVIFEFMKSELSSRDMLMAKMVEVMNRPQPVQQQHNIMEMIQALASLKTLDKSPHDNFAQIMEVFKMGTNIAKTMGDNSVAEAPENKFLNMLIEQLAPRLLGLMSAKVPQNTVPTTKTGLAQVNPPVNALAEGIQGQITKEIKFVDEFEKTLIEKLSGLEKNIVALAGMNFSTERAGDYLIDEFDDSELTNLEKYLKEYRHNRIVEFIPSFKTHTVWFDKLSEYLIPAIQEVLTPEGEVVSDGNGEDKTSETVKTEGDSSKQPSV